MTRRELLFAGVGAALTAGVLLGLQLWGNAKGTVDGREARSRGAGAPPAMATYSPPVDPSTEQAWRAANEDLAQSVSRVRRRLEENEAQKKALERELAEARARLAQADGGAPPRNPYDLTAADWKELAKTGSVRARFPCNFDPGWSVGDATAGSLGLSPSDKAAVEKAFRDEEARIADVVSPACAKVLGNAELAQRLGPQVCMSVVSSSMKDQHPSLQLVADIRAGNKAAPAADALEPFASVVLVESRAMDQIQADLTPMLGPQQAHDVAFSDELGSCSSSWGTSPP